MKPKRLTIASILLVIVYLAVVFAGLRSGTSMWMRSIYTTTFVTLVYAAIAARCHGAYWYGFAVAGWSYFVVAFGPWVVERPLYQPSSAVNEFLLTSAIHEAAYEMISARELMPHQYAGNRDAICHCALTVLAGFAGGWVAVAMARSERARANSGDA